jgi:hypothetical protein
MDQNLIQCHLALKLSCPRCNSPVIIDHWNIIAGFKQADGKIDSVIDPSTLAECGVKIYGSCPECIQKATERGSLSSEVTGMMLLLSIGEFIKLIADHTANFIADFKSGKVKIISKEFDPKNVQ